MSKLHRIPRGANSGVTFLGVELGDTTPLIISIFVSVPISSGGSWWLPVLSVLSGFAITKSYIGFKRGHLNGFFQSILYSRSIVGYSNAFNKQNKLFLGNAIMSYVGLNKNTSTTFFGRKIMIQFE